MSEPRNRYRIPPCPAYDIPAMESWLEDMAARGLHLSYDGFFLGTAAFEEGPKKRVRYRLEPTTTNGGIFSDKYDPDLEAEELLRQMGWVYRARRGQFHIYCAEDPAAPELNTDPQVQAITLEALRKYLWKNLCNTLLMILLYGLGLYGDVVLSTFITIGTPYMAPLAALLLIGLVGKIRTVLTLSGWCKQLRKGEPLPHRRDYGRAGKVHIVGKLILAALWVVLVLALLFRVLPLMAQEDYTSLDEYAEPLPFVTVEDLYPDAQIEHKDFILYSRVYTWSDLLSPENIDLTEHADVTADGDSFTCYLSVDYHRTRWDWVAAGLAREYVSQCGGTWMDRVLGPLFGHESADVTVLENTGWDYACAVQEAREAPWLILQKDNIVLRVRYAPIGDAPEPTPEALAELYLSQIQ